MLNRFYRFLIAALGLPIAALAAEIPDYAPSLPVSAAQGEQTAVLAGGCFWGVDAVFKHVKGVKQVVSGYAGGDPAMANYRAVSSGRTGHAEAVRITYDPAQISYGQLLKVFFSVAHDPTQLNRQGPDVGTQYRSAIFYTDEEQQRAAREYIDQLARTKAFSGPIVTQVSPLSRFFPAEDYHQNYLAQHPTQPYIVIHDLPKLWQLKRQFPKLYR